MKRILLEFIRRGMMASGFGPPVLAVVYLILEHQGVVQVLTVRQVCLGIISLAALAFVAGGMNVVYQIERLPLMGAIAIHGGVLYFAYLLTYLFNDWLEWCTGPILVFTGIFLVSYLTIWAVIYAVTKRNTAQVNKLLKQKQQTAGEL